MRGGRFSIVFVGIAALALSMGAWGQATTSLRGTVTDPSGAAISGAKVTLTNTATNAQRQTVTTNTGLYTFVAVQPGAYNLAVTASGFQDYARNGLQLMVNLPASSDVKMAVGSASQTVEVTGQAPLLNTTNATVGQTMGSNEIQDLPLKAENLPLLLSIQPGVVYNGDNILEDNYDTRAGSVNGERSDQNNITLDGVSINDEFHGYAFNGVLPTTPFSTQEFRVTTSNADATQARSAGAQIAMVTKSGTNNWHGSLYEFNRNTLGEANDFFLKASQINNGQPNTPQKLVRNIFGGTIGGPIKKDRLFFFFNYEGHRQSYSQSVERTIPTATLRDGIIEYKCASAAACPGGAVTGASGATYPVLPGNYGLGPAQLKAMDPLGIGPSSVALNYFKTYPVPNDFTVGNVVNYAGYRFAAPTTQSYNWFIGRVDYKLTPSGNHSLFVRGTVVDDRDSNPAFVPGTGPTTTVVDLSKGYVVGYTGVFGPRWVNSVSYGLTRQSLGTNGDSKLPWVEMRGLDQNIYRTTAAVSPVHNITDTLSYVRGKHNFQFGGNLLFSRRNSLTDLTSYSDALTNSDWVASSGLANKNDPLNPALAGYPAVASTFNHSYDFPLAAMMGLASEVDARYNYHVDSLTSGSALAQGAPVTRHWATDTYNLFLNDTWQMRHNLTLNYGLNYQLMTPVTETAGQEMLPGVNIGQWFNNRWNNMVKGIGSYADTKIAFTPAGSAYGRSGLYSAQTHNFAPRLGIAWKPESNWGWLHKLLGEDATVVRAGAGMYYDNFGPELAMTYDQVGAFGVSTSVSNPAGTLSVADVPRITSMNTIPTADNSGNNLMLPAPPANYPVTYPSIESISRGIDQSLKTPYSYALNLSVERTLPGNMVFNAGYVGHFAHRLLVYDDVATPTDLVDPKSGIDYFSAAARLSQIARTNPQDPTSLDGSITAAMIGPTAAYWQDMIGTQSSYKVFSTGATTPDLMPAIYDLYASNLYNETTALYLQDLPKYATRGWPHSATSGSYYNPQYSSLYVWRSIGHSNYNALQLGLHKEMSQGVLFGFNYTYSHSLDTQSMAERGIRNNAEVIINPWSPNQFYGNSAFDLRHQVNAYWVANLPFGHGRAFANTSSNWLNAIIGGWQFSGTSRWTSGFPGSVLEGFNWPTNWEEMGLANVVGPVHTGTTTVNGLPNVFSDPSTAVNSFDWPFPGQSGMRNVFRGDGYMTWDMALGKSFKVTERQSFDIRWNVFNVTNSARFDVNAAQLEADEGNTFGNYTSTLTSPRVMEFSAVFRF